MARDFNGSSDILSNSSVPSTATDNYTFGGWAQADSTTGEQAFACNGNVNLGYALEIESGNWKCLLNNIGRVDSSTAVSTGAWTHILVRRASGTSQMYINGSAAGSSSASAPNAPGSAFTLGGQSGISRYFDGRLAEFALWTVALDTAQIAALGTARISPLLAAPIGTLAGYWPLLGQASPEPDLRARLELTLTGTAAAAHPRIYTPAYTFTPTKIVPHYITGVTKDSAGAVLGSCTVRLFRTSDDALIATTTSDASTGAYSFTVGDTLTQYWIEAYKSGSPDVAGTTVRTVVAV